jgi:hypothetical protein
MNKTFKHSNSSINCFHSCKHAYDLLYNQRVTRTNNYYGQYGTAVHETMEAFLSGAVGIQTITSFFESKYKEIVTCKIPMGNAANYLMAGKTFFDNFIGLDKYEIVAIEKRLEFKYKGTDIVCVPDLILKEKSTGKYILYDYKTSSAKNKKECLTKVKKEHYDRQAYLYVWAIWESMDIVIDEIKIWFLRPNIVTDLQWNQDDIDLTREWFMDTIELIKKETEWNADNSNGFFCNFLCSARTNCPYKKDLK